MRVRYRSSSGKVSGWSATKVVSTKVSFVPSTEVQKIVQYDGGSGGSNNDEFGRSISISNDGLTMVVGAPRSDYSGNADQGGVQKQRVTTHYKLL